MAIWIIHGIVAQADPLSFTHRSLLDASRFQRFLERRSHKFVDLDQAVAGRGDALTIDDSTYAAAGAAELCRATGHAVTVFVNARNIAWQQTYWFALLNALVDGCTCDSILLDGDSFPLHDLSARKRFRKAAKHAALSLENEEAREAFILRLAQSVNVGPLAVPGHLATISLDRLRELQAAGVRIENHGWTHGNVAAMSRQGLLEDIRKGADWLRETISVETSHYAVPFGTARPPGKLPVSLYGLWHLADESLPAGRLDARIVNRETLSEDALL
ncbi:MAG TPA: polysaccharide deacetylase family protein [Thermoanaerobaculia bacterium]